MTASTFDTHELLERLEKAGIPTDQAQAQVSIVVEVLEKETERARQSIQVVIDQLHLEIDALSARIASLDASPRTTVPLRGHVSQANIVDLLAMPDIEDIDFNPPRIDIQLKPAEFS
ncbi:hypothetical protein [Chitinimonas lacunae]|uniref:DUF1640 domain-containing protein n=1 Tax=Chitinimonas lacunae TaxID=1963018 RepID=A0ABV8MMM0_9NEIS